MRAKPQAKASYLYILKYLGPIFLLIFALNENVKGYLEIMRQITPPLLLRQEMINL